MHELTPGLSVVIPVYNSQEILPELLKRLNQELPLLAENFEVILVNDGSVDESWQVLVKLLKEYRWAKGINLMRNFGQHNALLAGLREAKFDITITMDDDLQHPPEEIGKLIKVIEDGYDVVYGRPQKEQHGFLRDIASLVTKLAMQSTIGVEVARNISAFRAIRTQVREAFKDFTGPYVSIDVLLTWGTTRFKAISVRHDPRTAGKSSYTFRKLIRHSINMLTGFSILPLQLASLIGFTFTIFGFCVLAYVLLRYLTTGSSVPGFPFLASVIAIFSGAQLFALGIIGEYLARMFFRIMDKPSYVIRDHSLIELNKDDQS